MRAATVRAARRRGCVWPMMPAMPRPAARQIFGSCVVLPDPVSPQTMTTWCSSMARRICSRCADTGSSSGYASAGTLAARAARAAMDAAIFCDNAVPAAVTSLPRCCSARSRSRSRRRRYWSRRRQESMLGREEASGGIMGAANGRAKAQVGGVYWMTPAARSPERRAPAPAPDSSDGEDAAGDVPLAAVHLQFVVLAVEVVDTADLARLHLPGIRIAQVPAATIIAHDQLTAPGGTTVLAHGGADAIVRGAIAIYHHQPVIAHQHQAARRAEIVHPRQETPGASA